MKHAVKLLSAVLLASCQGFFASGNEVEETARQWAEAFYNYDFEEAARHVTPESGKWLQLAASNVTEADVALLNDRQVQARVDIDGCYEGSDTTATAVIVVSDYLLMDSIGKRGSVRERDLYTVELAKRDGRWKVRMAGLPRSERQSRD